MVAVRLLQPVGHAGNYFPIHVISPEPLGNQFPYFGRPAAQLPGMVTTGIVHLLTHHANKVPKKHPCVASGYESIQCSTRLFLSRLVVVIFCI